MDRGNKKVKIEPKLGTMMIVVETPKSATVLRISERKGLTPLLTPEQRAQYAITAATRQFTRLRWEYHLGKIHYASSHYAKLIRATIPITDTESQLWYVLLLTLDVETDNFHEIITKCIIPLVSQNTSQLIRK